LGPKRGKPGQTVSKKRMSELRGAENFHDQAARLTIWVCIDEVLQSKSWRPETNEAVSNEIELELFGPEQKLLSKLSRYEWSPEGLVEAEKEQLLEESKELEMQFSTTVQHYGEIQNLEGRFEASIIVEESEEPGKEKKVRVASTTDLFIPPKTPQSAISFSNKDAEQLVPAKLACLPDPNTIEAMTFDAVASDDGVDIYEYECDKKRVASKFSLIKIELKRVRGVCY